MADQNPWDVVESKPEAQGNGEWDVVSHKPESGGFLHNAWETIKGAASMIPNPLDLVPHNAQQVADIALYGPGAPIARGMIQGAKQQAGEAGESFSRAGESLKGGRVGQAAMNALEGMGHVGGMAMPPAAQVADTFAGSPGQMDKYGNETVPATPPQSYRGAGQAAALLGTAAAKEIAPKVKAKIGAATEAVGKYVNRVEPAEALTQALRPKSPNLGFADAVQRALPELKQTEQIAGTPITNLDQLKSAVELTKKRLWNDYEKIVGPQAQRGIDASAVADAMAQSIPEKIAAQNPGIVKQVARQASVYSQPLTIQQLEDYLKTANAELDAYYGKYPAARGASVRGNPKIAARVAEADALRKTLYSALDDASEGEIPAQLKRDYGAQMNIEREIQRRQNVAARQQPNSMGQQIGKMAGYGEMAYGGLKALTGNPSGLLDIAKGAATREAANYLREQQTTDSLIRRAFENYEGSPAPRNIPPPFRPKGLLGSPDIITPPPSDKSYVRSAPAMTAPPNPRLALPPASTFIVPPAGAQGVFPTTGIPPRGPTYGIPRRTPIPPEYLENQ